MMAAVESASLVRYNWVNGSEELTNTSAGWNPQSFTQTGRAISFAADSGSRSFQSIELSNIGTSVTLSAVFDVADIGKSVRLTIWDGTRNGLSSGASPNLVVPSDGKVTYSWTGLTSYLLVALLNSTIGMAQTLTLRSGYGFSAVNTSNAGLPYQKISPTGVIE